MHMIASKARLQSDLTETNCGIGVDVRLLIPSKKYDLVYGRPEHHISERATIALATNLARRSKVFIDVGANEGLFAFVIAKVLGPMRYPDIHLFEPDPVLFERLSSNLRRNAIFVQVNRMAAGASTGTSLFHRNLSDDFRGSMNAEFYANDDKQAVEVSVTCLADYIEANSITHACLKVDVEGFGAEVWDGLRPRLDRVDWLIMEMIAPEWAADLPKRILKESGWYAYYIRDFELRQWTDAKVTMVGSSRYDCLDPCYNWLFCPVAPHELSELLVNSPFRVINVMEWG